MEIELTKMTFYSSTNGPHSVSAEVVIDGFKAGILFRKEGDTPSIQPHFAQNKEQCKKLLSQAEVFCANGNEDKSIVRNKYPFLSGYLNGILNREIKEKEKQQRQKGIKRDSKKSIIMGAPGERWTTAISFANDIASLLHQRDGASFIAEVIKLRVLPHIKTGQQVLNTNIPESVYKLAGLKENQYVQPAPHTNQQKLRKKTIGKKGKSL